MAALSSKTADAIRAGIRRLAEERGIPLRLIAETLGVTEHHLSHVLNPGPHGRNPTLAMVDKLCGAYDLPRSYFLGDDDRSGAEVLNDAGVRAYLRGKGLTKDDADMILELIEDRRRRRLQEKEKGR